MEEKKKGKGERMKKGGGEKGAGNVTLGPVSVATFSIQSAVGTERERGGEGSLKKKKTLPTNPEKNKKKEEKVAGKKGKGKKGKGDQIINCAAAPTLFFPLQCRIHYAVHGQI